MPEAPSPFGAPTRWEDILRVFEGTGQSKVNRDTVAGPGSESWITGTDRGTVMGGSAVPSLDIWWPFKYTQNSVENQYVVGLTYDWAKFGNDGGALVEFTRGSRDIFNSVVPGGNAVANPATLREAAMVVTSLDQWVQGWEQQFKTWATEIGGNDSDLQGESAGLFKATLEAVERSLRVTRAYFREGQLAAALTSSGNQMTQTVTDLSGVMDTWMADSLAMPMGHLYEVFTKAMATIPPIGEITGGSTNDIKKEMAAKVVSPTYGSPVDFDFWDKIQNEAKASWLANVVKKLDEPSAAPMKRLTDSYMATSSKIPSVIKEFTLQLNKGDLETYYAPPKPEGGGGKDGPVKEPPGGDGEDPPGGDAGGDGPGGDDELGGGGAGGKGDGGLGDLDGKGPGGEGEGGNTGGPPKPEQLSVTPPGGASIGTGGGGQISGLGAPPGGASLGSGGNSVLDKDGKPLGDGRGGMFSVPPGSRIDPKTGAVTDAKGRPVKGADGKPMTVPKGSSVGPVTSGGPKGSSAEDQLSRLRGNIDTSSGNGLAVDSEGNVIMPKGAKIDAHGNLIGADGKPLTNAYGGKLSVPAGSRINADGSLTDPGGKHITESSSSLKTRGPKIGEETWTAPRRSSTVGSAMSELASAKNAAGLGRMVDSNGNAVTGQTVSPGLSSRAQTALGESAVAAEGARANQTAGPGGRAGGSGAPFMPPMGGGMGGGGGGGAAGGADRQRNVWVTEDEEVWGTDSDAPPGVIGR
ncbi:hypothetical protein [Streptomyces sp. H27-D2]|uniref:hypothetical protein n=1 Tax=Streptomyces sp. H27-D2 TaxID=3046304 RepID=UPI002DB964E9|nr:hypothetical protein [Streptomyces sp. H27-D2]MEC4020219.1 hypothetical protein [Streptomyces sp. H27-D2]